ncbi:multidrug effflux MFS transporter [Neoehrlichia mikurensis]|uniref:Bcr/CflA family efflux transporter n=1 Tax=Neoehrlichia mikurensis TaxID=89586 RepID=A0A9Q9BT20_9RICK|nr:multidrug effflux MFS transporter [Neoehrlichia mikurensis]QXK91727.1 multidrug effflux MFS transporter [Neoehrlichia mikurensis]QXK92939.1 multidrug effflux MFS transporter [Neoehrlichia mikurensis]QXK93417.1 multidrug effflux MFS transporter [Neoehrlichia mikurensis]UTO55632.1 multidrug effflux MFS transporter [Neoehrlichia mikurensis]UTO56553.1 multidrug effflux MFS transporter [Neoehrlichia mikurensis]
MQVLKKVILILVVMTITICDMSCDIYTPSLPKISDFFNVKHAIAQLTVSLNLIGGSLSGLLYGPLSDYYGRRPIMLIGIAIFGLASIGCCFVNNIVMLIIMRLIQGCGAGVAGVIGYAVINDMFSGSEECAKNISYVNMAIAFSPAIGPILGSSIISHGYDWNVLFMVISVLSVILFIFLYIYLKETIVTWHKDSLNFYYVVKKYVNLMVNMRFLGFALIYSLTIMWVWASIVNLPFVFIKSMNLPIGNYGYLIAIHVISYVIGTIINQRLVERVGMNRMLIMGLLLDFIPDIIVVIFHYAIKLTPLLIELIWIPSGIGIAFTISNSMASAFKEIQDSGTGSAFIVFLQTFFGALGIYIVECFSDGTIIAIAILPIICSIVSIVIYTTLRVTRKEKYIE